MAAISQRLVAGQLAMLAQRVQHGGLFHNICVDPCEIDFGLCIRELLLCFLLRLGRINRFLYG